jgi:Domain of unknown function (DUF4411)
VPSSIYCIDTSSILEWYVRRYPPDIFPGLLNRIEMLILDSRLRAPKAVYEEIKPGDNCHKWVKNQKGLFFDESANVQKIVQHLMANHHDHGKPLKGISGADPFVIAMAKDGGSNWTVISDEHPGSWESRKIPFVCSQEGVTCLTFKELMLAEGWQF